jgi:hypothetical protein
MSTPVVPNTAPESNAKKTSPAEVTAKTQEKIVQEKNTPGEKNLGCYSNDFGSGHLN